VLLSRADYEALEETAHLLRVPANARKRIESLQQALSGQGDDWCTEHTGCGERAMTGRAGRQDRGVAVYHKSPPVNM
jgi:hypothetical protein